MTHFNFALGIRLFLVIVSLLKQFSAYLAFGIRHLLETSKAPFKKEVKSCVNKFCYQIEGPILC